MLILGRTPWHMTWVTYTANKHRQATGANVHACKYSLGACGKSRRLLSLLYAENRAGAAAVVLGPNVAVSVHQRRVLVRDLLGHAFSAAGKMHGDLNKSAKDTTLKHSIFAAFNTE